MPKYTGIQIANIIRRERKSGSSKTYLLVEGKEDRCVFSKFVSDPKCKVRICSGDIALIEAISELDKMSLEGYLGVKDADFDIINGCTRSENMFSTEGHDLEVMVLSSCSLERVLHHRLAGRCEPLLDTLTSAVRHHLFQTGAVIGYLRFVSDRCEWGINIQTSCFLKHFNSDCEIALHDAIQELEFAFPHIDTTEITVDEFQRLTSTHQEHLCNGHDLVYLLGAIFPILAKRILGS